MKASIVAIVSGISLLGFGVLASEPKREVSFDRDVMPILGQKCFKCHGPDAAKAAAGLRLDSLETAKKNHVIVPGSPSKSLAIQRITEKDPENRMPPPDSGVKPLTSVEIQTLRSWIASGAKYEKHWSYVPPVMPTLPKVKNVAWGHSFVDKFVLAQLEANGMQPEPEADKPTLAMRASQVLTGLPVTPDQVQQFLADTKPGAYERLVDRLLASPAYGEHQARYWLDAVRYGDTHGLQLDNERGVYPYRDWVVRAFNSDLPYDSFVKWQLAGDMLPNPTPDQLTATGYVRMNLTSNEGGAIEEEFLARNTFDRVETTGTVLLGMTLQCSRCHDHKYDPISQKDYFGLYAFFNSTKDNPLDGNITFPAPVAPAPSVEQQIRSNALNQKINAVLDQVDPLVAIRELEAKKSPVLKGSNWQISPVYSHPSFEVALDSKDAAETNESGWKPFTLESGKDYPNLIKRDNASIYVRGTVTAEEAGPVTFGISSDDGVKVWLNGELIHEYRKGRGLNSAIDLVKGQFRKGENSLLIKVVNGISFDGLNLRLQNVNDERISTVLTQYKADPANAKAKRNLARAFIELGAKTPLQDQLVTLGKQRMALDAEIPLTLVAQELEKPRPTFVLKRGVYDQKGDRVERHIPKLFGAIQPGLRMDRLGLAQWMTSPANPLVSRVFVNRVWQQYFGTGLVKTSEDFGSQGDWPANGKLLDALAVKFREGGWSIKALNRLLVTSAAFRQSAKISKLKFSKDPENRLISRGPRFRLDAEAIRDKALHISGLLVQSLGGRGFKPYQPDGIWEGASDPASSTHFYVRDHGLTIYRRSLYMFWKRTAPPPSMTTLDSPLRDTCVVRRATTNTPLQALTLQNDPTFLEASRVMAERLVEWKGTDTQRIQRAVMLAFGRPPQPNELSILNTALTAFRNRYANDEPAAIKMAKVGDAPIAKLPAKEVATWMLICSTLMNTDEFLTVH